MGQCISGCPRTGNKGLGNTSVKGRMRSPRPAASTMACAPMGAEGCCMGWTRFGEVGGAGVSGVVVMPECCHGFCALELMRWLG
jgi:hypothetical protein